MSKVSVAFSLESQEGLVPTHEAAFQVLREDRGVVFNEFYREPLLKVV